MLAFRFSKLLQLFAVLWTVAHQKGAPLSLGFSMQEYWVGFPPPGHLSNPRIEPAPFMSPTMVDGFFTTAATWEFVASAQSLFPPVFID